MSWATLHVEGFGLWAPSLPGWDFARRVMRGEAAPADPPARRPAPQMLAPAERRRVPDSVALALEVASAATQMADRPAAQLASVFVSAHGDLAINDYMCSTLASQPTLVSPTKFHHSVHNAPAGYWSIGTGCMQPSVSLSACEHSFAAGLQEAACLCVADARPVLLVGVDIEACGALASVTASEGLLAAALVLAPQPGAHRLATLEFSLVDATRMPTSDLSRPCSPVCQSLSGNALAPALPLFDALAREHEDKLLMSLSPHLVLQLNLTRGGPR